MATLTDRIRDRVEIAAEFVKLAWRHRGCFTCMNAELYAERERLYAEIIGAAHPSRLSPLDVSYRFGVDDQAAVWRAIAASGGDTVQSPPSDWPGYRSNMEFGGFDESFAGLRQTEPPADDQSRPHGGEYRREQSDVMSELLDKVIKPPCFDPSCERTDHTIGFGGVRYHPAAADTAGDGTD